MHRRGYCSRLRGASPLRRQLHQSRPGCHQCPVRLAAVCCCWRDGRPAARLRPPRRPERQCRSGCPPARAMGPCRLRSQRFRQCRCHLTLGCCCLCARSRMSHPRLRHRRGRQSQAMCRRRHGNGRHTSPMRRQLHQSRPGYRQCPARPPTACSCWHNGQPAARLRLQRHRERPCCHQSLSLFRLRRQWRATRPQRRAGQEPRLAQMPRCSGTTAQEHPRHGPTTR